MVPRLSQIGFGPAPAQVHPQQGGPESHPGLPGWQFEHDVQGQVAKLTGNAENHEIKFAAQKRDHVFHCQKQGGK